MSKKSRPAEVTAPLAAPEITHTEVPETVPSHNASKPTTASTSAKAPKRSHEAIAASAAALAQEAVARLWNGEKPLVLTPYNATEKAAILAAEAEVRAYAKSHGIILPARHPGISKNSYAPQFINPANVDGPTLSLPSGYHTLCESIVKLSAEKSQLTDKIASLSIQTSELQNTISQHHARICDLTAEIKALTKERDTIQTAQLFLREEFTSLDTDYQAAKQKHSEVTSYNKKLEEKNEDLKKDIQSNRLELHELKTKANNAREELSKLTAKESQLTDKIIELTAQIEAIKMPAQTPAIASQVSAKAPKRSHEAIVSQALLVTPAKSQPQSAPLDEQTYFISTLFDAIAETYATNLSAQHVIRPADPAKLRLINAILDDDYETFFRILSQTNPDILLEKLIENDLVSDINDFSTPPITPGQDIFSLADTTHAQSLQRFTIRWRPPSKLGILAEPEVSSLLRVMLEHWRHRQMPTCGIFEVKFLALATGRCSNIVNMLMPDGAGEVSRIDQSTADRAIARSIEHAAEWLSHRDGRAGSLYHLRETTIFLNGPIRYIILPVKNGFFIASVSLGCLDNKTNIIHTLTCAATALSYLAVARDELAAPLTRHKNPDCQAIISEVGELFKNSDMPELQRWQAWRAKHAFSLAPRKRRKP